MDTDINMDLLITANSVSNKMMVVYSTLKSDKYFKVNCGLRCKIFFVALFVTS